MTLLAAKLFPLPVRPGALERPALLQRVEESSRQGSCLTLICAPAGYGKSTLAAACLQHAGARSFRLSLDEEDNHPLTFLAYLSACSAPRQALAIVPLLRCRFDASVPQMIAPRLRAKRPVQA